jgi:AcrR family transcriptional regulator
MTASTSISHHEAVASIIAAARTSLPDLVDRVAHRIRTEIPCYAAGDVAAPADLRASVRANVDYILDTLTGTARANLGAPDATGRTRAAQGVPLAEMLTAYRVGVAELWSALVTAARGLPGVPADDVIELAGAVFAAQNTYSDAALAAYRDEAREILRTQERERAALVEVILTGAAAKGTLWEVANALRLPLDGAFLVIAAETQPGHDPIPRAESALAVIDVRSVWRLDAEVSLGVLSLPDRSRNGTVLTVLDKHATHRIGASPVFGELHQAGCHPNTVRSRLRRIEAGTGRVLAKPGDVAELVTAVRAWRELPHS